MGDLGSAFPALTDSRFRLETLQAYAVAEERDEYEEFLRTGRLDSPGDVKWREMISGHVDAGRSLQRVHVIEEPLTDYVRYEIAEYVRNREAGEDIRLLPVPAGDWPEGLPQGTDFWLLDDGQSSQSAWAMAYDNEGRFLGVEEVQDPDLIDTYRRWRDTALGLSVPLNDYRRQDA